MRTFVEITGGKLKRVSNRLSGCQRHRFDDDDDERDANRAARRRDRRVSRQQLRLQAGLLTGDRDAELDDHTRDGTTIITGYAKTA